LTTLNTSAQQSRTTVPTDDLIWQLNEEADRFRLEEGLNKASAAMMAAHAKAQTGTSGSGNNERAKGKAKIAQIARRRVILKKIALQRVEERQTKPQIGGRRGRKRQKGKRTRRKV
jgi:hypothetical protein